MNDRELGVEEAYNKTCTWLLDKSRDNESSTNPSQFLSWLRTDESFFWVSGKAGCGKSTLMKYAYQNETTREELLHWAGGKSLVMTGHFFFDRGDQHQKSREGMLRSILYQVLSPRHDLIPKVFGKFFTNKLPLPQGFSNWSNLSSAFIAMLDNLRDCKICLFLDGLDEYRIIDRMDQYTEERMDLVYDGTNEDDAWGRSTWITEGHKEITRFLRQLENRGNLKICFSSRELNIFEHEFRNYPRLRVHEHTAKSIERYCKGRLREDAPDLMDSTEFASSVTEKSFGVFLWVRLVVDMLVDGNNDGDSKEELLTYLTMLPSRLGGKDGLYMRMMKNIKREHLPESKRLFQLIMMDTRSKLDIITLFLAEPGHLKTDGQPELRARSDKISFQTWEELRPRWKNLERRLKSRCGGLLEGTDNVRFMHQTAKEFMSRNYLWDEIFHGTPGFSDASLGLALISGFVRRLKCCKEAVVVCKAQDSKLPNDQEKVDKKMLDPFECFEFSPDYELLDITLSRARALAKRYDLSSDFIALLDELNITGNELFKDCKHMIPRFLRQSLTVDGRWVEFLVEIRSSNHQPLGKGLQIESFLELAIVYDIPPYVEAYIKGIMIPQNRLQRLLLLASRTLLLSWKGEHYYKNPIETVTELLLQEGADPNLQDTECYEVAALGEGQTAWTALLNDGFMHRDKTCEALCQPWIATLKVFLKYGADPAAQWHMPRSSYMAIGNNSEGSHGQTAEIYTAESAITAALRNKPEFQSDYVELLDLLNEAKINWVAARAVQPTEDVGRRTCEMAELEETEEFRHKRVRLSGT